MLVIESFLIIKLKNNKANDNLYFGDIEIYDKSFFLSFKIDFEIDFYSEWQSKYQQLFKCCNLQYL